MIIANKSSTVLSARKINRPMPRPIRSVTPGARNFSGPSRNEMATTMPSHTKTVAVATRVLRSTAGAYDSGILGRWAPTVTTLPS